MRIAVDVSWEASAEPDLAGYKITWGQGADTDRGLQVEPGVTTLRLVVRVKPDVLTTVYVQAFDLAGNKTAKRFIKAVYLER